MSVATTNAATTLAFENVVAVINAMVRTGIIGIIAINAPIALPRANERGFPCKRLNLSQ